MEKHPQLREGLSVPEFNGNCVTIVFIDNSYLHFRQAFLVSDEKHADFAVFTEHFGYFSWKSDDCQECYMTKYTPFLKV